MATKTFEELKQLAIQIRDEKTNKQNTATRVGTAMMEGLNKLEQDYYDKTATDKELKERDDKLTELSNNVGLYNVDKNVPLGSGFYTSTTARAAVPTSVRKLGLIITYKTDETTSVTEQFIGSAISAWNTETNWEPIYYRSEIYTQRNFEGYFLSNVDSLWQKNKYINTGNNSLLESSDRKVLYKYGVKAGDVLFFSTYGKLLITVGKPTTPFFKIIFNNVTLGTRKDFVYTVLDEDTNISIDTSMDYPLVSNISTNIGRIEKSSIQANIFKTDIGSLFGAKKVLANNTSKDLIFDNFKSGLIIKAVNLRTSSTEYWTLQGLKNNNWVKILDIVTDRLLNKDIEIPKEAEEYEKIKISCSGTIASGYAYLITELEFMDVINALERLTPVSDSPVLDQELIIRSSNLLNPYTLSLSEGWWVTDYIPIEAGVTYYGYNSFSCFSYDGNKKNITSTYPFSLGEPANENIKFIRIKTNGNVHTPTLDDARIAAKDMWFSKTNMYEPYGAHFNRYLLNTLAKTSIMPHYGKKIYMVADSYNIEKQYHPALLATTGLVKIGDTDSQGNGMPLSGFPGMIIANKELISQADFVTILGGTNDYGGNGPILGTINDCIKDEYENCKTPLYKTDENGFVVLDKETDTTYKVLTEKEISEGESPKSVYAAIMTCVNIIHTWNPRITVVLCSEPERGRYPVGHPNCYPPLIRDGKNMNTIAKAMREIHEMFGVPFYDMHANGWTLDQVSAYTNDELHPNGYGGYRIGQGLGMYINTLGNYYPNDKEA